jgi:hypothetical protein
VLWPELHQGPATLVCRTARLRQHPTPSSSNCSRHHHGPISCVCAVPSAPATAGHPCSWLTVHLCPTSMHAVTSNTSRAVPGAHCGSLLSWVCELWHQLPQRLPTLVINRSQVPAYVPTAAITAGCGVSWWPANGVRARWHRHCQRLVSPNYRVFINLCHRAGVQQQQLGLPAHQAAPQNSVWVLWPQLRNSQPFWVLTDPQQQQQMGITRHAAHSAVCVCCGLGSPVAGHPWLCRALHLCQPQCPQQQ